MFISRGTHSDRFEPWETAPARKRGISSIERLSERERARGGERERLEPLHDFDTHDLGRS